MSELKLIDHALVLAMGVLLPLNQYLGRSQLQALRLLSTAERIRFYRRMIVFQWVITFLLLGFWWLQGRRWSDLGLSVHGSWGHVAAATVAAGALGAYWLYHRRQFATPPRRERLRQRMDRIAPFLPRTRDAIPSFDALSLTAGVCEEILYRGFFLWYAVALLGDHPVGFASAVLLTSAVFSLGHVYQGTIGVATVFGVGILQGLIYWISGALWIPMILHALLDAGVGRLSLRLHPDGDPVAVPDGERRTDLRAHTGRRKPAAGAARLDA